MAAFTLGQTVPLTGTFVDVDGNLTDPTTVTLTVTSPTGITSLPPVSNPSIGIYTGEIVVDETGIWYWQWEGDTAGNTVIDEGIICVNPSSVGAAVS